MRFMGEWWVIKIIENNLNKLLTGIVTVYILAFREAIRSFRKNGETFYDKIIKNTISTEIRRIQTN